MESQACLSCGTEMVLGAAFCPNCGRPVALPAAVPAEVVAAVPADVFAAAPAAPADAMGAAVPAPDLAAAAAAPIDPATAAPIDPTAPADWSAVPAPAGWPAPVVAAPAAGPRIRIKKRFVALGLGIAAFVAVVAAAAMILMAPPTPQQLSSDLVKKMTARDATASSLLESNDSMRDLAGKMGLIGVPGSVTVTIENVTPSAIAASPSGAKPATGDEAVQVTYTVKLSGPKGQIGKFDQTLTAVSHKGTDGKAHFINFVVKTPVVFDAAGYFDTKGTTKADSDKVAADLKAGNSWLSGVEVSSTVATKDLTLPEVQTKDPKHLSSWREVVSPDVTGTQTTWQVSLKSGTNVVLNLSPATAQTKAPVAAQVNVGSMTDQDAEDAAGAVINKFNAAAAKADTKTANSLVLSDGPKVSSASLSLMRTWRLTGSVVPAVGAANEGAKGPEVKNGRYTVVMDSEGAWHIDVARSRIPTSSLGNGDPLHFWEITANTSSGCTAKVKLEFKGAVFYSDGSADGVFQVTGNKCDMGDEFVTATVTWRGNTTGVVINPAVPGADSSTSAGVYRFITLPDGVTPGVHPIHITIDTYGNPTGATTVKPMLFVTT